MIIATLLVRDEEDIIAANLQHHIDQGIDAFIVTNHRSTDNTIDIVKSFPQVIKIINKQEKGYYQDQWVSKMAHMAANEGAKWIVHLDADEFWYGFDVLNSVPESMSVVYSATHLIAASSDGTTCRNFLPLRHSEDTLFDPENYPYFSFASDKPMCGVKIAHRPSLTCKVSQGNHDIYHIEGYRGFTNILRIDHYPIRSYGHFERKVRNGGEAYARSEGYSKEIGWHWRLWYEQFKAGKLRDVYNSLVFNEKYLGTKVFPRNYQVGLKMRSWAKSFI